MTQEERTAGTQRRIDFPHFPDTATVDQLQGMGGVLRCNVCLIERGLGDVGLHMRQGWPMHHGQTMTWVTARQLREEGRDV